jgi:hypothetical protein
MAPERDLGQEPRQDPEEIRAPAASAAPNGARMISDSAPAPPATALSEPMHMLDDAPLPTRYDVDECVAIPVDPRTLYVYWEVREQTLAIVRSGTTPAGAIALRVIVIVPTWDGPRSSTRDHDVHSTLGDYFITDLPAGSVVRAAIGLRCGELFVPIAHSPPLETPPGGPSPLVADVLVRWTPKGVLLPISPSDRDAESIARALGHIRRQEARDSARKRTRGNVGEHSLGGSSERWALRPEG